MNITELEPTILKFAHFIQRQFKEQESGKLRVTLDNGIVLSIEECDSLSAAPHHIEEFSYTITKR